jgi:type I restriction enzyme M protein
MMARATIANRIRAETAPNGCSLAKLRTGRLRRWREREIHAEPVDRWSVTVPLVADARVQCAYRMSTARLVTRTATITKTTTEGCTAGRLPMGPTTGSSLVDFMAALLEPIEGTVYDPACGTAMFLASVWKDHSDTITQLHGQEINQQSWRLGFLHLLLQNAPFQILTGDTMVDDRFWQLRADRIAVEPPIGHRLRSIEQMEGDPRWSLGLPPKPRADLAWVQHVAYHLSDAGVGVVIVPPGALLRTGRSEVTIRKGLVEADHVDAVLYLPPGMLAATSVPVAVLVLQKKP